MAGSLSCHSSQKRRFPQRTQVPRTPGSPEPNMPNSIAWIAIWSWPGRPSCRRAAVLQTWEHRRYARSCMREHRPARPAAGPWCWRPAKGPNSIFAKIFAPSLQQDYDDYEVASSSRRRRSGLLGDPPHHGGIPRGGQAAAGGRPRQGDCGQKVHNLRAATADLPANFLLGVCRFRRAAPAGVVAAAIGGSTRLGATTGYRWFMPSRPSLAQHSSTASIAPSCR